MSHVSFRKNKKTYDDITVVNCVVSFETNFRPSVWWIIKKNLMCVSTWSIIGDIIDVKQVYFEKKFFEHVFCSLLVQNFWDNQVFFYYFFLHFTFRVAYHFSEWPQSQTGISLYLYAYLINVRRNEIIFCSQNLSNFVVWYK